MWGDSARRLLASLSPADVELGVVALYMCVDLACKLVTGTPAVPKDEAAVADCPVNPRALRKTRDGLGRFRGEILHLHDDEDRDYRQVSVAWQAEKKPRLAIHYLDERSATQTLAIEDVDELLDQIDPWLRRHHARMLAEERGGSSEA
jgi:hypothetical protein